jgi:ABC-type glycerol-3-phosphate transport system permease component
MLPNRIRTFAIRTILFVLLAAIAIAYFVPIYWMIVSSFKTNQQIFTKVTLLPKPFTLKSYASLFQSGPLAGQNFLRWYLNTVIMTCGYVLVALATITLGGYAFAQLHFRGRNLLFIIILATQMIPFHLMLIPLFIMISKMRMVNTYWGAFLPIAISPFGLFYMRQFMSGISRDLIDAARVDGATEFKLFFSVIVPLVKPALAAMAIYFAMEYWNNLLWPLIAMRTEEMLPLAVGIASLVNQFKPRYDMVMAASTLATLPVFILFFFLRDQFYEGMGAMAMLVEK